MSFACLVFAAALQVFNFATNSVAERLADPNIGKSVWRFSEYPPSRGRLGFPRCLFQDRFPANEHFWLKGVDFSCVSPWNEKFKNLRAGTLISPRHVVFAAHFAPGKGRIDFVAPDGDRCTREIGEARTVPGTDIQIAVLSSDVSSDIRPAKILPENYADYIGDGGGLPVVTFNQNEEALLTELSPIWVDETVKCISSRPSRDRARERFRKPIVSGDSGNPVFLLVGDQPILLCCLKTGGYGAGPSLCHYRKEVQETMDKLCPGYTLETFDFGALAATLRKSSDF